LAWGIDLAYLARGSTAHPTATPHAACPQPLTERRSGVEKIDNIKKASQLARAIASDIAVYNTANIEKALREDNFFEVLADEIEEGRTLFESRVTPEIYQNTNIFAKAIIDILICGKAHLKTPIW
jgi:hypothetical protein